MSPDPSPSKLITQKEVMKLLGVGSRETLDRWIRQGLFTPPIRIGGGRLRWVLAEVEAWIEARKAERSPNSTVRGFAPKAQSRSMPAAVTGQRHA